VGIDDPERASSASRAYLRLDYGPSAIVDGMRSEEIEAAD
jgi:hypothetical protein